jgi:hypothetical protein
MVITAAQRRRYCQARHWPRTGPATNRENETQNRRHHTTSTAAMLTARITRPSQPITRHISTAIAAARTMTGWRNRNRTSQTIIRAKWTMATITNGDR